MTENKQETIVPIDPETVQQPQLHVNDIIASRNIIKVALERGTFRDVEESRQVHDVFARMDTFSKFAQGVELFSKQKAEAEAVNKLPEVKKQEAATGKTNTSKKKVVKSVKKAAKKTKAKK